MPLRCNSPTLTTRIALSTGITTYSYTPQLNILSENTNDMSKIAKLVTFEECPYGTFLGEEVEP